MIDRSSDFLGRGLEQPLRRLELLASVLFHLNAIADAVGYVAELDAH